MVKRSSSNETTNYYCLCFLLKTVAGKNCTFRRHIHTVVHCKVKKYVFCKIFEPSRGINKTQLESYAVEKLCPGGIDFSAVADGEILPKVSCTAMSW